MRSVRTSSIDSTRRDGDGCTVSVAADIGIPNLCAASPYISDSATVSARAHPGGVLGGKCEHPVGNTCEARHVEAVRSPRGPLHLL